MAEKPNRRFFDSPEKIQTVIFWGLIVVLILNVIVAIGQWQIYPRLSEIETVLGLRGTQK